MELGNFSISLKVEDLRRSRDFYEKLGFSVAGGDESQNYLIMKNGMANIGLFQGMFDKNILTFNPGWDNKAGPLEDFEDVRKIQNQIKSQGIELITEVDENTSGPGAIMLVDPDGNPILIDQHV